MAVSVPPAWGSQRTSASGLRKYDSMSRNAMVTTFASSETTHSGSSASGPARPLKTSSSVPSP